MLDVRLTYGAFVRGRHDLSNCIAASGFWRAMNSPEGPVTLHVTPDFDIEAWGPGRDWALDHSDGITGAHDDPDTFVPLDARVRELHRRAPGLRVVRMSSAFDFAVATILEQRVTTIEARRSWQGLVRRHGTAAPGPVSMKVPPSPATLAALPDHEWRRLGVELRRSGTIRRIAARADWFERACDDRQLRAIDGIGPWTAAHITHFVYGNLDAVPVGDWHLPRHIGFALAGEHRADDARMLELLEPFRPQRARAWRLIVSGMSGPPRRAPRARIHNLIRAEAQRR